MKTPATASRRTFPPSARLVRFVSLLLLLQAAALVVGARFMIRAIRSDGGMPTEYVFFGLYGAVLVLGAGSVVLAVAALMRRVAGPAGEAGAAIVLGGIGCLALVADEGTFAILGLHPYGKVLWVGIGTTDLAAISARALLAGGGFIAAVFLLTAALWRLSRAGGTGTRWERIAPRVPSRMVLYFALGLVTFRALDQSDAERVVPRAALPFYALWLARSNSLPDARPAYPMSNASPATAFTRRPDIIVLFLESWRWDILTPDVMPALARLAASPLCTTAPRHYAGGHLTQYGTFSLFHGLEGYAFLPFMQESRPSEPLAALKRAGYRLEGYDKPGVLGYTIAPIVPAQWDRYETMRADTLIVERILASLREKRGDPRFLFGFFYSTHASYTFPPAWNRFPTSADDPSLDTRQRLFNRYRNSAGYLDSLIARITSVLAPRLADGRAVLVVTGDHGEEFREHGTYGHAAVAFDDVRTRVPLVLCATGAREIKATLSDHADVLPTLFDWMGAAGWDSTQVTGRSLYARSGEEQVSIAGAGFPTQAGAFALVTPSHKFWLHLTGPDLRAIATDRATDTLDRTIPLTPAVQQDLERALSIYLRKQHDVLRVDGVP